jgi:hypothetical protein
MDGLELKAGPEITRPGRSAPYWPDISCFRGSPWRFCVWGDGAKVWSRLRWASARLLSLGFRPPALTSANRAPCRASCRNSCRHPACPAVAGRCDTAVRHSPGHHRAAACAYSASGSGGSRRSATRSRPLAWWLLWALAGGGVFVRLPPLLASGRLCMASAPVALVFARRWGRFQHLAGAPLFSLVPVFLGFLASLG